MLATDKVRYQGQEVAFVIAEDRYSARDSRADRCRAGTATGHRRPQGVGADAAVTCDDLEGKTDNHIFDWESGDKAATDAVPRRPR